MNAISLTAASEVELDFDRRQRSGLDEAVYAEHKSVAQIDAILAAASDRGVPLLLTRLTADKAAALHHQWQPHLDYCALSQSAYFGTVPDSACRIARVAIVAAGTSDARVAREVERTLTFRGVASRSFFDVGVAGLWRLTSRIAEIRRLPIVIAIAGMDAALPTVLGGLVPGLVIAVPTSVGYGVAAGGQTALNAILASCTPGITVVNIDNGYGAACAALRALQTASRLRDTGLVTDGELAAAAP